jgi:probable blue pigment (indigoidine) exporter
MTDIAPVSADARPSTIRMIWIAAALGGCFVLIRSGLADAPTLWFATLRSLLAGVVLVGLATARHRPVPHGARQWGVITALGMANGMIGLGAMYLGAAHLSTGVASVVANAQPLLIVLPAWALYQERPTRRVITGLVVGIVGLIIVAIPAGGGSGAVLSLSSAAAATAGTLIARRLGTLDNLVAAGWSFLLGGVGLAGWSGATEGVPHVHWNAQFVAILAFLGIIGTAAVYVAWFKEARRCPLYRLAAWTFAVPLFGLALAVVVNGERPSLPTASGLFVVLVSMWIVLGGQRQRRAADRSVFPRAESLAEADSPPDDRTIIAPPPRPGCPGRDHKFPGSG